MQMITQEMTGRIWLVYPREGKTENRNSFDVYVTSKGRHQPRERLQGRTNEYKHEEISSESEAFPLIRMILWQQLFKRINVSKKPKILLRCNSVSLRKGLHNVVVCDIKALSPMNLKVLSHATFPIANTSWCWFDHAEGLQALLFMHI